jgi:hypothetical protein
MGNCYNFSMRRLWIPILVLLAACQALKPEAQFSPTAQATKLVASATLTVEPAASDTPTATVASPTPGATAVVPTATISPLSADQFTVRLHPDGALYVGDQVSFEVIAPQGVDMSQRSVQVSFPEGGQSSPIKFGGYGIAGRTQATLLWAWNTAGLSAGEHTLTYSLQPDGLTWTQLVTLLPHGALPAPENGATWAATESDCCLAYYITGTEAERDLPKLLDMLDQQAVSANQRLQASMQEAIPIIFIPRVLGHGGFAGDEIAVSYLDRNYAGSDPAIVVHHEMVHLLDARLGGELRPSILVEGLAVYLSGGHFKPEPLMPRAAALLPPEAGCIPLDDVLNGAQSGAEVCGLSMYEDLEVLVDQFYFVQHEVGYLEAGALVEFMVDTWGLPAFSSFYRDIHPPSPPDPERQEKGGQQYRAMDAALQVHFGLSLDQLEERFYNALQAEQLTLPLAEDVRMTVLYYDTVRRYQQLLDPSAYFLTAWLPDGKQMRERGIVADLMRRPDQPENIRLENWLVDVYQAFLRGDFSAAQAELDQVGAELDKVEP